MISISDFRNLSKSKEKFNRKKKIVDGITFDSTKEADYYIELKLRKKNGLIKDFDLQPKFKYQITYTANGIDSYKTGFYKADFKVIYNDREEIVDVKGFKTKEYKRKKKIIESLYRIKIIEK